MDSLEVLNSLNEYYCVKSKIYSLNKKIKLNAASLLILLYVKDGYSNLFLLDEHLSMDRALIYRTIKELEGNSIIIRVKKGKSKNISLTEKGGILLNRAIKFYMN